MFFILIRSLNYNLLSNSHHYELTELNNSYFSEVPTLIIMADCQPPDSIIISDESINPQILDSRNSDSDTIRMSTPEFWEQVDAENPASTYLHLVEGSFETNSVEPSTSNPLLTINFHDLISVALTSDIFRIKAKRSIMAKEFEYRGTSTFLQTIQTSRRFREEAILQWHD